MVRNFKTQLAGQIGESLVVAELGRRNIVGTAFAGNVPDIDLLAYANDTTLHLQIKAWRTGSIHFDAARYMHIAFDGDKQTVRGLDQTIDAKLIYVFVKIGESAGQDRFFILLQSQLQQIINDNHCTFLDKHNGVRPRNSKSTYVSVEMSFLKVFENNWALVEQQFGAG